MDGRDETRKDTEDTTLVQMEEALGRTVQNQNVSNFNQ